MPGVDLFVEVLVVVDDVVVLEEVVDVFSFVIIDDDLSGMSNEKETNISSFVHLIFRLQTCDLKLIRSYLFLFPEAHFL